MRDSRRAAGRLQEAKRNFYLGGLRLSAVEGGRFCEATFRLLQQRTTGKFNALGNKSIRMPSSNCWPTFLRRTNPNP